MTTDLVFLITKELKKQYGVKKAAEYEASEVSKYSVNESLFFKYFFKFLDLSLESEEMYVDAEKNVLELVSVLEKNKLYDHNYQKACDYLYRISIKQRKKNQALQAVNRLSYILCLFPLNYILICKEMSEKTLEIIKCFKVDSRNDDVEYLYQLLNAKMLEIAWAIVVDWDNNIQRYNSNKILKNKFEYKDFEIYNNICWDINDEDSITDYFEDDDVEVIKRLLKDFDEKRTLALINDCFFKLYPISIDFELAFLEPDFNDLDTFGLWFQKFEHTKESYQCTMMGKANEIANNFIKQNIIDI